MKVLNNWIGICGCTAIVAAMTTPAWAQTAIERATGDSTPGRVEQSNDRSANGNQGQPPGSAARTPSSVRGNSQQGQAGQLDQQIAACLLLGNQEEVVLAQLAQSRAQSEEVKQFAQHMMEQHQQAIAKIEQAAPQVASLGLDLTASAGNNATGTRSANARGTTGAAGQNNQAGQTTAAGVEASGAQQGAGNHQALEMAKDIKQQCLQLTQQALSEKQGAEFDKAYMGQQVAAHMSMLAELRGSQKYAGQQLRPIIQEGEQMAQQHLTQAKEIMEQLKDRPDNAGPQTSQRVGDAEPRR
jgi:predicted outer membrane protein